MNRPRKAFIAKNVSLLAALLLSLALLVPALSSAAASAVHYEKESKQAYETQLSSGEIQEAAFNKKIRSLHIILKDGKHFIYIYPAHDEPTLDQQLTSKGISVTILSSAAASKEAAKPVKHKLRYIAGGVLIVIIVIVGVVLYVDRKRKAEKE